jgi:hypothetical protein
MIGDPVGKLYSLNLGTVPNFHGGAIDQTFTASGTIDVTGRMVLFNGATGQTLTLPNGVRDGQPLTIKNLSTNTVTISGEIDLNGSVVLGSLGAERLTWQNSGTTWLSV